MSNITVRMSEKVIIILLIIYLNEQTLKYTNLCINIFI